jgi:hypothetical protein
MQRKGPRARPPENGGRGRHRSGADRRVVGKSQVHRPQVTIGIPGRASDAAGLQSLKLFAEKAQPPRRNRRLIGNFRFAVTFAPLSHRVVLGVGLGQ